MMLNRTIGCLVVVAAGSIARPHASMAYSLVDLDGVINPTRTAQTAATAVNASGVVVGEFDDASTALGFVISNGAGQFLPTPDVSDVLNHWNCHPFAINASATIVGFCELVRQHQDDPNAFDLLDQRATVYVPVEPIA